MIKASSFKAWCTDNISPQSWTRICLKNIDMVRSKGYTLKKIEELNPDIELDSELFSALNEALFEFYKMEVDSSTFATV